MTVSSLFPKKFPWLDEGFLFLRCKVSTNKIGNFLTKHLSIKAISGFLRRKLLGNMFPRSLAKFPRLFPQGEAWGRLHRVSYRFPQKFPSEPKSFLNPVCRFVPRKQETFDRNPSIHAGVYSFLGWKQFPCQETLSFLESFQRRNESCLCSG